MHMVYYNMIYDIHTPAPAIRVPEGVEGALRHAGAALLQEPGGGAPPFNKGFPPIIKDFLLQFV